MSAQIRGLSAPSAGKFRDYLCPGAFPDLTDSRIPLPHFRTLKSIQSTLSSFGIYRLIDGLEFLADSRTVFVGTECSGRSNQVHNAGLMKCLWVDRFDGFRHALQAICNGNEDVFYASSLVRRHSIVPTKRH